MNCLFICGYIGRTPELRRTQKGTAFCRFSVATKESYRDKTDGSRREVTHWHDITVWGKTAEYFEDQAEKGMLVTVRGRLRYRDRDVANTTVKVADIVADELRIAKKSISRKNEKDYDDSGF